MQITERPSKKYSLPISHKNPVMVKVIDVSIRPSILGPWSDKPPLLPTWETLQKVHYSPSLLFSSLLQIFLAKVQRNVDSIIDTFCVLILSMSSIFVSNRVKL